MRKHQQPYEYAVLTPYKRQQTMRALVPTGFKIEKDSRVYLRAKNHTLHSTLTFKYQKNTDVLKLRHIKPGYFKRSEPIKFFWRKCAEMPLVEQMKKQVLGFTERISDNQ